MSTLHSTKAREIAYSWHGGQDSPLYAFASSGLIADLVELDKEIARCEMLAGTVKDCLTLAQLRRYIKSPIIRAMTGKYPFAAPWANLDREKS